MDNMYVIGYRIDIKDKDAFDFSHDLKEAGFSIDTLPGKDWMIYPSTHQDGSSIWIMNKNHPLRVDYRCPIDRSEIWQDLRDGKRFDVPETYNEHIAMMIKEPLYKWLDDNLLYPKINWGIAIMLG